DDIRRGSARAAIVARKERGVRILRELRDRERASPRLVRDRDRRAKRNHPRRRRLDDVLSTVNRYSSRERIAWHRRSVDADGELRRIRGIDFDDDRRDLRLELPQVALSDLGAVFAHPPRLRER